jgi:hypothetical protein
MTMPIPPPDIDIDIDDISTDYHKHSHVIASPQTFAIHVLCAFLSAPNPSRA